MLRMLIDRKSIKMIDLVGIGTMDNDMYKGHVPQCSGIMLSSCYMDDTLFPSRA